MNKDNYATWLEIDLGVIANNFKQLEKITNKIVMPVIKANAYGHGLEEVAMRLENVGAKIFGVARIEEALHLREYGIKKKILVLGYTAPARVEDAIRNGISLTVYDFSVMKSYSEVLRNKQNRLSIHAKVDSGMGRLGIPVNEAMPFLQAIINEPNFLIEGIFTHFACADEVDTPYTNDQIQKFNNIIDMSRDMGIQFKYIHAANSAGTMNYPESHYDLVRCGIILFGLSPSSKTPLPAEIKPALCWKTRLISIKELPENHGISYGFAYRTKKKERIGVIAVGYGDGMRRQAGNEVLIHGKRARVVGNVCMDQCMVQIDDIAEAKIGDEVVLIGEQQGNKITATDIAARWGTINYEVICGMAARMPRVFIG